MTTMQQQHSASARNRRLAQQMENRPSVQAALQNKQAKVWNPWLILFSLFEQMSEEGKLFLKTVLKYILLYYRKR